MILILKCQKNSLVALIYSHTLRSVKIERVKFIFTQTLAISELNVAIISVCVYTFPNEGTILL